MTQKKQEAKNLIEKFKIPDQVMEEVEAPVLNMGCETPKSEEHLTETNEYIQEYVDTYGQTTIENLLLSIFVELKRVGKKLDKIAEQ